MNQERSLKELGYTVESTNETDVNGKQFAFKVTGPPQVYFIRKLRNGKLRAYKDREAKVDSAIVGLWDFEERQGDLIGKPLKEAAAPVDQPANQAEVAQVA